MSRITPNRFDAQTTKVFLRGINLWYAQTQIIHVKFISRLWWCGTVGPRGWLAVIGIVHCFQLSSKHNSWNGLVTGLLPLIPTIYKAFCCTSRQNSFVRGGAHIVMETLPVWSPVEGGFPIADTLQPSSSPPPFSPWPERYKCVSCPTTLSHNLYVTFRVASLWC